MIKNIFPIGIRYWLVSNYDKRTVIGFTDKSDLDHCLKQDNVCAVKYLAWNKSGLPIFAPNKDLIIQNDLFGL